MNHLDRPSAPGRRPNADEPGTAFARLSTSAGHRPGSRFVGRLLLSLGLLGLGGRAGADSATVIFRLDLGNGQDADQARIAFVRQFAPMDTVFGTANALGNGSVNLELDAPVAVDPPAARRALGELRAGSEPAGERHWVFADAAALPLGAERAPSGVYNLLGQRVAGLDYRGQDAAGTARFAWEGASRHADGVYLARVGDRAVKLLNLRDAPPAAPFDRAARVDAAPGQPAAKGAARATDDWVPTAFWVNIEPTAQTDHPFVPIVQDEVTVNSLNFQYIRNDLVPLTHQAFAGRAIELATLGRWGTAGPVAGLDVRFRNVSGQLIASTQTDADGYWAMDVPFTDTHFNVDGMLEITSPQHLIYRLADLHIDYTPAPVWLPADPNGYPGPMHTALVLRRQYVDPLTEELTALNEGLKQGPGVLSMVPDGDLLAMVFRGATYPIYFVDISEWGVGNFTARYGSLIDDNIALNTFQGVFLFDEVLGSVHGRILERVFSPILLSTTPIENQYNGLLDPQPFRAYEGIMLENTGNNYCETRFRGPPYPHVIMAEQETADENPTYAGSHHELCRSTGFDNVTAYESVMNPNSHHSLTDLSEPGARTDRVNFRAVWGVQNVIYADSLATPGALYRTFAE